MPYIKVSPNALSSMSETLRNSSSKVGQIEGDFSGVARKLDWDVRSASDIQRRMDRIIDELEEQAKLLGKMRIFIAETAIKKYAAAQKQDTKLKKLYLDKVSEAIVDLDKSMMTEAEKIEERQKAANIWNLAVTIGCAVGSIAIIAATGGMAAPAVFGVMVATSTVTGMLTSATNNLTSQYVEDGFADGIDMHSLGTEVAVGTVSGLIGGVISGGIGAGANLLTAKATSSALASSNSAFRIITAAGINAGAEVVEGGVRDGAVTYINSGGDFEAAKDEALDDDWKMNAAFGAIVGGGSEILKTVRQHEITKLHDANIQEAQKKAQAYADEAVSNFNKKKIGIVEAQHSAGLKNIKQAKNGAADYSDSDYILRNDAGEVASFKTKMLNDSVAEEQAIKAQLKSAGFKDFDDAKHAMHYMADYDVATGECTVQVVERNAKGAFDKARGPQGSGKMQYRILHGGGYGKSVDGQSAVYVKPGVPRMKDDVENLTSFIDAYADALGSIT